MVVELFDHEPLLILMNLIDNPQQTRFDAVLSQAHQCANIFGKAASAVARARKQECKPNAAIVADAAANIVDVGHHPLTEFGHFIDESDR
jgi:hypothetical protein